MQIWVDADACPKVIKELLYRVAGRTKTHVTFVANKHLFVPQSPHIKFIMVAAGSDVADVKIVEMCEAGDMVVTADIPLASAVVKKGAYALNPRGDLYNDSNIGEILAMRNMMDSLRGGLMEEGGGGPPAFTARDRESFANALDKFMNRKRT